MWIINRNRGHTNKDNWSECAILYLPKPEPETKGGERKREENQDSDKQDKRHTHRSKRKSKFETDVTRSKGSIERFLTRQKPSVAAEDRTPSGDKQLGGTQDSKPSINYVKSKSGGNPKGSGRDKFYKHPAHNSILSYLKPIQPKGLEKEAWALKYIALLLCKWTKL